MTMIATRRKVLLGGLTIPFGGAVQLPIARAQAWPSQPIRILVGGAAGSVPDTLARLFADYLSPRLGSQLVVENRPGSGGILAIQSLLSSAADGHTFAIATMSQAVFNSYLFPKLSYDPRRDLLPIAPLASGALTLAAHPGFQAASLVEMIALTRRTPEKFLLGLPLVGSPPHVVALLLARETGMRVKYLNFKSGSDLVTAGIRGDVQLLIDAPTLIASQVDADVLKAIAVTGSAREASLPQIPTVGELGFPTAAGDLWIGLVGQRSLAGEIAERLNRDIAAAQNDPVMFDKLRKHSFRPVTATVPAFADMIEKDHARWSKVIREAGLTLG